MALYLFHCTNGRELVADERGFPYRSPEDVLARAGITARRLMDRDTDRLDWSAWTVCVMAPSGHQILAEPFPVPSSPEP